MSNGLPFLIPLGFVLFSVAHLFSFLCCVVCLSSYCVKTNIHNAQYEDKHTYTIHSTKTNTHTQYTVRRQTNIHNTQYEDKQTYTIHSTKTNKHTQYIVRRQTNIHNTQYENKQTYTTHSTKTNKHTQYIVLCCVFVFVLCIVYVCLSSYNVLCMFVCLRTVYCVCLLEPRGIKNGNPLDINQNVRRQTKRKYTTQNRKLKS
jgi:Flp pilus assembly protein TadB